MWRQLWRTNYFFNRQILIIVVLSLVFKLAGFVGIVYVNNLFQGSEEAGRFFLSITFIQVGLVLVNLGHSSFYARLFARNGRNSYKWAADLKYHLVISIILGLLFGYTIAQVYHLPFDYVVIAVVSVISYNFICLTSGIVRGYQDTAFSFIIQNLLHLLWPLLTFLALKINKSLLSLNLLLLNYAAAINLSLILALVWIVNHWRQQGTRPISWKERQECLVFYTLALTALVLPYADKLILGLDQGRLAILAGYQGIAAIFAFYDVITFGLGWVLMPRLALEKKNRSNLRLLMLQTFLIILGISVVALFLGSPANAYLYGEKFRSYNFLIKYFVGIGALKIIFSVQTSLISAQGEPLDLWLQGVGISVLMGLSLLAMKYGLEYWGLQGLMLAQIFGWAGRCLITTGIIYQGYRKLRAYAVA